MCCVLCASSADVMPTHRHRWGTSVSRGRRVCWFIIQAFTHESLFFLALTYCFSLSHFLLLVLFLSYPSDSHLDRVCTYYTVAGGGGGTKNKWWDEINNPNGPALLFCGHFSAFVVATFNSLRRSPISSLSRIIVIRVLVIIVVSQLKDVRVYYIRRQVFKRRRKVLGLTR